MGTRPGTPTRGERGQGTRPGTPTRGERGQGTRPGERGQGHPLAGNAARGNAARDTHSRGDVALSGWHVPRSGLSQRPTGWVSLAEPVTATFANTPFGPSPSGEPSLMLGYPRLFLDDHDPLVGVLLGQTHRGSEANNSRADNSDVVVGRVHRFTRESDTLQPHGAILEGQRGGWTATQCAAGFVRAQDRLFRTGLT